MARSQTTWHFLSMGLCFRSHSKAVDIIPNAKKMKCVKYKLYASPSSRYEWATKNVFYSDKSYFTTITTIKQPTRVHDLYDRLIMLLLLLLIGFGYAEKSVLIIGGDEVPPATVEQFFPSSMTSRIIGEIEFHPTNGNADHRRWVKATPVNATHAILLPWMNSYSYYIDVEGKQSQGPVIDIRDSPGLTSMPGENGQMTPIYCGGRVKIGEKRKASKDCKVISSRQHNFEPMLEARASPSLTAFNSTLIVIGSYDYWRDPDPEKMVERYDGTEWVGRKPAPVSFQTYDSAAVKLNKTALLTCGGYLGHRRKCYVYHVDKDDWTPAPDMKGSGNEAEMVLIDQTVYAFGGDGGRANIQTLDISQGFGKAQWKLWKDVKLKKNRITFGVWVIDSTPTKTMGMGHMISIVFLILFLSIVAYFFIGVLYRHFVVGAHGMELLPNHSFWLKLYRGTCLCSFSFLPRIEISMSTESLNYNHTATPTQLPVWQRGGVNRK